MLHIGILFVEGLHPIQKWLLSISLLLTVVLRHLNNTVDTFSSHQDKQSDSTL